MTASTGALAATRRERPVWFLDVDGVISPYGLSTPWPGKALWARPTDDSDLTMPYRSDVVSAIQQVHESGLAEVRWLTTWDEYELSDWARVGLGPFHLAPRPSGINQRHWKLRVIAAWLAKDPDRLAVWTDDDAIPAHLGGVEPGRLLVVAPDHTVGLLPEDIAAITLWLRRLRGLRRS